MADAEYVRQLEDAALALWAELPAAEVRELRAEMPRLVDFLAHLHRRVEHEQAMVRPNVWAEPSTPLFPEMIDYLADAMRDEPELFDDDPDTERRTPLAPTQGGE